MQTAINFNLNALSKELFAIRYIRGFKKSLHLRAFHLFTFSRPKISHSLYNRKQFLVKFETEKNVLRIIDLHLYRLNLVVFRVVVNSNRIVFKLYNTSSMQFYCRCRRQLKVYNCKKWTQGQISYLCHGVAPVQNT